MWDPDTDTGEHRASYPGSKHVVAPAQNYVPAILPTLRVEARSELVRRA